VKVVQQQLNLPAKLTAQRYAREYIGRRSRGYAFLVI